jgi:hypothetical protein
MRIFRSPGPPRCRHSRPCRLGVRFTPIVLLSSTSPCNPRSQLRQSAAGLDLLAAAQITLAVIRNAWDMMLWIVIRAPTPSADDRDGT